MGVQGCPRCGPVEGLGKLDLWFLVEILEMESWRISSWLCASTCWRIVLLVVLPTVACGGAVYSSGICSHILYWWFNSALMRLTILSTRLACPYPASSRFNSPALVILRCALQKCTLKLFHVIFKEGRQFQDLMDSWNLPVRLIKL